MYNLLNASRSSLVGGRSRANERKQRNSLDRHSLRPLLDDNGTDEKRYYRSAEFQQALVEDQISRAFLPSPSDEPQTPSSRRLSRSSRRRGSTAASKSSLPWAMLEVDMTRAVPADAPPTGAEEREERSNREECGGEPDIASSPYASVVVPPEHNGPASTNSSPSSDPEPEAAEAEIGPSRRHHRVPRIHLSGPGSLLSRVRSRRHQE